MKEINGELSAKGLKIAIAASRFNSFLVEQLVKGAEDAFIRMGGSEKDLTLVRVPGAYELPFVAAKLAATKPDAIVCLGAVVQGATAHADLINQAKDGRNLKIMVRLGRPVLQATDPVYQDYTVKDSVSGKIDTSYVFLPNHFDYARYDFGTSFSQPATLKLWLATKRGGKK